MKPEYDVVVIGAGLAGAAAAWQLVERGRSVLVLEAFEFGHRLGSSHGSSRIYRRAYQDPFYVGLTGEAEEWWTRLEGLAGDRLRVRTGGLDSGDGRDLLAMAAELEAHGVDREVLQPAEVTERWSGMAITGPVLFHPAAGYLDPAATMAACLRLAVAGGAEAYDRSPVLAVSPTSAGVVVETADRHHTAELAVVAAGGWLPELWSALGLGVPMPSLTVRQQEVFHFRRRDPSGGDWPTLVHNGTCPGPSAPRASELYGLTSGTDGGPEPAVKVAQFDSSTVTTASGRDFGIDPKARETVTSFVRDQLPGLEPDPVAEQSCLFTMTPSQDFVLDRRGPVVIASPCSGHGAKFAPLTGAMIADLVEGRPARPRFRL